MSASSVSCEDTDYAQDTIDDQHAFAVLLQNQGGTVRGIVTLVDLVKVNCFRCRFLSRMAVGLESLIKKLQDRVGFEAQQKEEERAMCQQLADFYDIPVDDNNPEPVPCTNHEASSTSSHEHLITGAYNALKNCLVIILQWQCLPLKDLEVSAIVQRNVLIV
jgi:hypothetical protein